MLVSKQISGLSLLFSSKKVCCHCGVRHNDEMDLYGTDYRCAIRLRANEIVLLARLLITIPQVF